MKYSRTQIPTFALPEYRGERYPATVPDTLDLHERAALAVNALTEATDPDADFEIYWRVSFIHNPAMMQHDWSDQCQAKFMEALPLMRIASGSRQNEAVERRWMEVALKQIGPDGLSYQPIEGRPWAAEGWPHFGDLTNAHHPNPFYNGRMASVFALYAERDPDGPWKDAAIRLVDGLRELAVDDGRCAYYWPNMGWAKKSEPGEHPMPVDMMSGEIRTVPLGMVHVYRLTGYEPALDLARKVNVYLREQHFSGDGAFICREGDGTAHFHAHAAALLAMVEYARVSGEGEWLEFALKGYAFAKSEGETLSGYFPEFVNSKIHHTSELCQVADMIALAVKLSEAGVGDFWDDADRWTRNMFAEGQLIHTDWVERMPEAGYLQPYPHTAPLSDWNPAFQTTDRVAERNVGAFASWPTMTDWYAGHGAGISHCCTGNAARTLYQVWESILRYDHGKLKVNLLLNRASPWADVSSHIPYTGRVDIEIKAAVDLAVRIPEWVKPEETQVCVDGDARAIGWEGRYALVGNVAQGNSVTLTFPIAERKDRVYVQKTRYDLVRRGNEIVSIFPRGRFAPLYQRSHYRTSDTRWRDIERFVSAEHVYW